MEKTEANALEMATQENETREAQKEATKNGCCMTKTIKMIKSYLKNG
ncbi:MAG: hypothetical protein NZ889_02310 [Candidatus Pacearchaeota archaeon]|nr:hypothetical protein [Candidatus Pacearchaeota archaeon]